MSLIVSGKNIDLGSLRGHAENRIGSAIAKYFNGGFSGQVIVERDGRAFKAECTVRLDSGIVLHTEGKSQEALASFDLAAERIEKRLRRYKRRLRDYPHGRANGEADIASDAATMAYVIAAPNEDEEEPHGDSPAIIAEEPTDLPTLTAAAAVMQLDLSGVPVLMFRNAGHGGLNAVYRRKDGNFGWLDPTLPRNGKH